MGKGYDGLPACLKTFIGAMFKTIDIDGKWFFGFPSTKFICRDEIFCEKQPTF